MDWKKSQNYQLPIGNQEDQPKFQAPIGGKCPFGFDNLKKEDLKDFNIEEMKENLRKEVFNGIDKNKTVENREEVKVVDNYLDDKKPQFSKIEVSKIQDIFKIHTKKSSEGKCPFGYDKMQSNQQDHTELLYDDEMPIVHNAIQSQPQS